MKKKKNLCLLEFQAAEEWELVLDQILALPRVTLTMLLNRFGTQFSDLSNGDPNIMRTIRGCCKGDK